MAWESFDEIYSSPEAVEQAPKVTTKEPQRLRDLADLLTELQVAKEDGYLAGLSYLDTSRGIKPIIKKLYHGSRYKHKHLVSFPPFSVLVNFICTKARTCTDPSFHLFIQEQVGEARKDIRLCSKDTGLRNSQI